MTDRRQIVDDFVTMLNETVSSSIEQNISFERLSSARNILLLQSGPVKFVEDAIKRIEQVNQDVAYVIMGTDKCVNIGQDNPRWRVSYISHNKRFDDSDIETLKEVIKEKAVDTLLFFNNFVSSVDFSNVEHLASFAEDKVAVYSYSYVQQELNRHVDIAGHIYGGILYKNIVEWFENSGEWRNAK